MKKIFLSLLIISAFALTTGVSVKAQDEIINPECPNGCVPCGKGCYCYELYPWLLEYDHGD